LSDEDVSWHHVRHAEAIFFERFHSKEGTTNKDRETMKALCMRAGRGKKQFLFERMERYLSPGSMDWYFDSWKPYRKYKRARLFDESDLIFATSPGTVRA